MFVHFPYKVKIRLFPNSRSFVANPKARNAIVGAENLLKMYIKHLFSAKKKMTNMPALEVYAIVTQHCLQGGGGGGRGE